ncbi:hypothetical protein MTO96_028736 [Rhipicephalus appendiculatus]
MYHHHHQPDCFAWFHIERPSVDLPQPASRVSTAQKEFLWTRPAAALKDRKRAVLELRKTRPHPAVVKGHASGQKPPERS